MPALRHHTHHDALATQKGIGAPGILPGRKPLAFRYDTILRLTSNLPGSVRGYRNITRTEAGEDKGKVLDDLGITRYCCRRMLLSHIELVDVIAPYQ